MAPVASLPALNAAMATTVNAINSLSDTREADIQTLVSCSRRARAA